MGRLESVNNAIDQTVAHYAGLAILYGCAGGFIAEDMVVTEVDVSVWQYTQSLDLLDPFLCCRHRIPALVKAGGGAIVNRSSVAALRGSFPLHVYTAAKGGVIALTRVLAGTYAKDKIRTNVIRPGVLVTDRVRQRLGVDRPQAAGQSDVVNLETQLKKYPFSVSEPENVARVALFPASGLGRSPHVTGAVVPVDGGLSAY